MQRIPLLLYSHFFPPSVGGVETFAAMLADSLAGAPDIDLTVATGTPGPANGGAFHVLRQAPPWTLAATVKRSRVIIMMGLQPQIALAARAVGVPVIWVHANHDVACPKTMGYRWQDDVVCSYEPVQCWRCLRGDRTAGQALRNIAALHARRALFDGAVHVAAADIVRKRLPRGDAHVIRNSCDTTMFHPLPEVPRDLDRVLFVARLIPEKGAHVFIPALARATRGDAPDLHAVIFGTGPERERLEELARREGVAGRVEFRGDIAHSELPREFAASLAVVNPQLWDWVLGIQAIEVLACGRPLVSTRPVDAGELPEDVALLFPRGDVDAFAAALVRVRNDAGLRRRLEDAGPPFVERDHSIGAAGARYLSLIRSLVS